MFKLRLIGIGGHLFNVFKKISTNRKHCVTVNGKFSKFRAVVSRVPQRNVLGPLLFILFTADMWNNLENKSVFYADNTTLYSELSTHSDCVKVADAFNRDLLRIETWCST